MPVLTMVGITFSHHVHSTEQSACFLITQPLQKEIILTVLPLDAHSTILTTGTIHQRLAVEKLSERLITRTVLFLQDVSFFMVQLILTIVKGLRSLTVFSGEAIRGQ